jgi:alanine dehydrogenase
MSIPFRLLTESDVKAVLTMDDLIETMASALQRFSTGKVEQPVRSIIPVGDEYALFATMPAFVHSAGSEAGSAAGSGAAAGSGDVPEPVPGTSPSPAPPAATSPAALGAKLVTVFASNASRGLETHLATILLLDPQTGALRALLDGRYITEARTAAVSAVSARLLAKKTANSLAIIGSGVQARSHLDALGRVRALRNVSVWSPNQERREAFAAWANGARAQLGLTAEVKVTGHAGEAVVGADLVVLATSSSSPVIERGWVKPGAHIMSVGACRPTQREMDPALTARARLFVDSRAAALVESGDVVMGIKEGRFSAEHIEAELGEVIGGAPGRRDEGEITIFKSLGLAVEDVTAADLAYRRAVEQGIGATLDL